jgi:actinin alpha
VEQDRAIKAAGITSNMYAVYTAADVTSKWNNLGTLVGQRKQSLEQVTKTQTENDKICQAFAGKAKQLKQWAEEQLQALAALKGEPQQQLEKVRSIAESIRSNKDQFDALVSLDNQLAEKNVAHNPHTEETLQTLKLVWDGVLDAVENQQVLLEKEILSQSQSTVTPEQLAEFQETFKTFDKDNSGCLQKHEMKACLASLGHDASDAKMNSLFAERAKTHPDKIVFDEFVDYMVKISEDSDNPNTIKNAFKTIAADKEWVSEQDLKIVFQDKETLAYLLANLPKNADGNYDYVAFTGAVYA